jgi:uncharacterized protein YjbI with pentapeptide repeats
MNFTIGLKRTSIYAATVVLSLAATTANAACWDPAAPGVDWNGCDKSFVRLVHGALSGADLRGADLSNAWLSGADLSRANLGGADLSNAMLEIANLSGANLSDADLSSASMRQADLSDADLRFAQFRGADLRFAKNLRSAILRHAQLSGATWTDGRTCGEGSIGECK